MKDNFHSSYDVIVACNRDKDIYAIRPWSGGARRWVNRRLLTLDPRFEPRVEPDDPIEPDDSSGDEDDDIHDSNFLISIGDVLEGEGHVDLTTLRRSTRPTKGIHPNPGRLPRSILGRD